jgi:hypothetical protein
MKRLHTFEMGDVVSLSLLRAELDRAGIAYITRNDGLMSAVGGLPVTECHPQVWILDEDDDFYRAQRILRDLLPIEHDSEPWKCPNCAEKLDGQFHSCWNCGTLAVHA